MHKDDLWNFQSIPGCAGGPEHEGFCMLQSFVVSLSSGPTD